MRKCSVDWYHQLEMYCAKELRFFSSSRAALENKLYDAGFLEGEVEQYMASGTVDWNHEAMRTLTIYDDLIPMTPENIRDLLEDHMFEEAEIAYAIEQYSK